MGEKVAARFRVSTAGQHEWRHAEVDGRGMVLAVQEISLKLSAEVACKRESEADTAKLKRLFPVVITGRSLRLPGGRA